MICHISLAEGKKRRMSAILQPDFVTLKPASTQTDRKTSRKISRTESLALWHRVTIEAVVNDAPDLSSRQLALLMTVYLEKGPHTVRSLAKKLNVTKAVIVRAIDKLAGMDFVRRAPDHRDKRSIILTRTPCGIHYLTHFADIIQAEFSS